jgi:hypothetical protein
LIGANGILPIREYLAVAAQRLGAERYLLLPTLCWIDSSDAFLSLLAWGGVALGILLFFDVAPLVVGALAWIAYLSLTVAGQDFLSFQWDALLLETGFLALLVMPLHGLPRWSRKLAPPGRGGLMLLWWLLFKLTLSSGAVKLLSGDATWRNLTALEYHYETQPLPTWIGWWAHQLPDGLQRASTLMMFGVELAVPWIILAPARWRRWGFLPLVGLQLLIATTGNYAYFNLLTIALCVLLLDDAAWPARLRRALRVEPSDEENFAGHTRDAAPLSLPRAHLRGWMRAGIVFLWVLSSLQMGRTFGWRDWPGPVRTLLYYAQSLHVSSNYGLFAVMTTTRPEIRVEGSDDGTTWKTYEFRWKPGDVQRRPGFVAPHQPRLDWQMWFAALGSFDREPWFGRFCERLLLGTPAVTQLLATNPFPDHPPRYVRARQDRYRFTNIATRSATGAWWESEPLPPYSPTLSLRGREPSAP